MSSLRNEEDKASFSRQQEKGRKRVVVSSRGLRQRSDRGREPIPSLLLCWSAMLRLPPLPPRFPLSFSSLLYDLLRLAGRLKRLPRLRPPLPVVSRLLSRLFLTATKTSTISIIALSFKSRPFPRETGTNTSRVKRRIEKEERKEKSP